MTRVERRQAARKARTIKMWKKAAAGVAAVATMLGGMGVASTALASDRDSYQDTVGQCHVRAGPRTVRPDREHEERRHPACVDVVVQNHHRTYA